MTEQLSDYDLRVIAGGDVTSGKLNEFFAPTKAGKEFVRVLSEGMNGITTLQFPASVRHLVALQVSGDPTKKDLREYGRSVVDETAHRARKLGIKLRGFSSVIDSRSEKFEDILPAIEGVRERLFDLGIAATNGEFAVHGDRVRDVTIGGFFIGEDVHGRHPYVGVSQKGGVSSVVFRHDGKPVYVNNDGNGTKGLLQLMRGNHGGAVHDAAAMLADDTVKIGAHLKALLFLADYQGAVNKSDLYAAAMQVHRSTKAQVSLALEHARGKLTEYAPGFPALNVGGAAISLLDEGRAQAMPVPSAGDTLIYVTGKRPNPRSNGITADREALELLGRAWKHTHGVEFWHETPEGKDALAFFAEPSVLLYPAFSALLAEGAATGVYHPSGGGFLGKLARPLAKQGLYVHVTALPAPDRRQLLAGETLGFSAAQMYNKWNMGVDGFVATSDVECALGILACAGLEGIVAGTLERRSDRVGVYLDTAQSGKISYAAASKDDLEQKKFIENIS